MRTIEDDCVCCDIPCSHCGADRTPHYYCDRCQSEFDPDELYDYDGEDLCEECLIGEFDKIDISGDD